MDRTEAWQMLAGIIQAAQLMPAAPRCAPGSMPLTVIGGFLGAGKTTLVNHLLAEPHGRRIAVLVNDFGRIDIDADLIRSRTDDMIRLTNGCACCSVAGDLTRALIGLAESEEPPEAIVLEASGLADPLGIAQVALANPALRLDGLLTVVDAETLLERANDEACRETFLAQVGAADLVVLNKQDLAPAELRAAGLAWLDAQAPGRPVIAATHGEVPAEVVLGLDSGRNVGTGLFAPPHHARGFEAWCLEAEGALDRERVGAMMDELPAGVLRAKGILWLAGSSAERTIYQRVGRRGSFAPGGPWDPGAPASRMVVIGRAGSGDQERLQRRFLACRAG